MTERLMTADSEATTLVPSVSCNMIQTVFCNQTSHISFGLRRAIFYLFSLRCCPSIALLSSCLVFASKSFNSNRCTNIFMHFKWCLLYRLRFVLVSKWWKNLCYQSAWYPVSTSCQSRASSQSVFLILCTTQAMAAGNNLRLNLKHKLSSGRAIVSEMVFGSWRTTTLESMEINLACKKFIVHCLHELKCSVCIEKWSLNRPITIKADAVVSGDGENSLNINCLVRLLSMVSHNDATSLSG